MEALLPQVIAAEPVERKFLKAVKSGDVTGLDFAAQIADAESKGVISEAERKLLEHVRKATFEFISVDDFDSDELRAATRRELPSSSLRSVA